MLAIIDYGMGNLGSVSNACAFLKLPACIVTRPEDLTQATAVILPGVGGFGDCMAHLDEHGFAQPLREWIAAGRPFLGICLGLQVLYEASEEAPGVKGLGVLAGTIRRFRVDPPLKVPQIGWNSVRQTRPDCPLFRDVPDGSYFYFVHSYRADAAGPDLAAGLTDYGGAYTSVLWRQNVMAVQFHPEKSQRIGLRLFANFAAGAAECRR